MPILTDRLAAGAVILIDGGTGTEIQRRGVDMVDKVWCGVTALDDPEILQTIHEDYIARGAEMIIANTFASSRHVLDRAGFADQFEHINRVGVERAVAARTAMGAEHVVVAGSISPTQQGATQPSPEVGLANYLDQARILAQAGADMIVLEMLRDLETTAVVLEGAMSTGLPIWAGFSAKMIDGEPWLWSGEDRLADGIRAIAGRPIELVAIMHTEIEDVDPCLDVLDDCWDGPVGVYSQRGGFDGTNWLFTDTISPAEHTDRCLGWIERRVQVVGGCCGIGPEHIEHLRARIPSRQATR